MTTSTVLNSELTASHKDLFLLMAVGNIQSLLTTSNSLGNQRRMITIKWIPEEGVKKSFLS